MDPFQISVDGEWFRVSERGDSRSAITYDFTWLNGPADGTYGFSVEAIAIRDDDTDSPNRTTLSREQLTAQVQGFVDSFYEEGGIGQTDFPEHVPARRR